MRTDDTTDVTDVDTPTNDETGDAIETTERAAEVTESATTANEDALAVPRVGAVRRTLSSVRSRAGVILPAVALVASAGLAAWLFFYQYQPVIETGPASAKVAQEAATNGTVALLSYSPDSVDKDFAAAKSHLTGDFLSYFVRFTEQIVTPAAKQKSIKTRASVVRSAVAEMHSDSAVVLVFIDQNTTSKDNPDGSFSASAVKVGLKKINGSWLISSFDPV